jgi:hypothetical protein
MPGIAASCRRGLGWPALDIFRTTASRTSAVFQDDPADLGAAAANGTLNVDVSLTVTTDQAGAGSYGYFILGDPPGHGDLLPTHVASVDMFGHMPEWRIAGT